MYRKPVASSLELCKSGMQRYDGRIHKAAAHPRFELRRQIDFRHEKHHLRFGISRQNTFDDVQVDLGFTGSRYSEKQKRSIAGTFRYGIGCGLLLVIELRSRFTSNFFALSSRSLARRFSYCGEGAERKNCGNAEIAASPRERR